jgi:hypothetical protein
VICLSDRRWKLEQDKANLVARLLVVMSSITVEAHRHGLTYRQAVRLAKEHQP